MRSDCQHSPFSTSFISVEWHSLTINGFLLSVAQSVLVCIFIFLVCYCFFLQMCSFAPINYYMKMHRHTTPSAWWLGGEQKIVIYRSVPTMLLLSISLFDHEYLLDSSSSPIVALQRARILSYSRFPLMARRQMVGRIEWGAVFSGPPKNPPSEGTRWENQEN